MRGTGRRVAGVERKAGMVELHFRDDGTSRFAPMVAKQMTLQLIDKEELEKNKKSKNPNWILRNVNSKIK